MIAEFSIVPISIGESLSSHVAKIIKIIDNSDINYKLTPMGTIVEGSEEEVFAIIRKCHNEMKKYSNRVLTKISIDDRGNDLNRMENKLKSVREKMNGWKKI